MVPCGRALRSRWQDSSQAAAWRRCGRFALLAFLVLNAWGSGRAEEATFFRGLNLNGPPVTIDGYAWEGADSKTYRANANAFDNQSVPLVPETDPERAKMIRSSRWGDVDITLFDIPNGLYTVYLYLWEDNNSETFRIALNEQTVVSRYESGAAGHWERLGPFEVPISNGELRITSRRGAANFSGVEIWKGRHGFLAAHQSPEGVEFFEKRIRPLLVEHCYECHSSAASEIEADLVLDSRPGWLKGGQSEPAILPGNVDKSLLIRAVRYHDADLQMPPAGKLSDAQIADLEAWVRMGAPDPREQAAQAVAKTETNLDEARQFWSFQPVVRPTLPTVSNAAWPKSDIDHFILAALEQRGLTPVAPADKRTLIRRATFDLIGLPPTPEEVQAFLDDSSPEAFEKVVDRLLASPHYGERWGRHWMDLVRYADTAGDNSDYPVPQLYRYRNYVIDSLNRDKPFDEFVTEQLAGDLMPAESDEQKNERIIATGYIALARRFGSLLKNYPQHLTIEDTIDNLGRTFLGLSIGCARCHDHKFDPISQEDYYGLYGIFDSTRYPFPGIELDKRPRDFVPLVGEQAKGELAYAVAEGKIGDAAVQRRGEPRRRGEIVPRRFPEVLGGQKLSPEEAKTSGRLQLAGWITDPKNPLTARVMVNRLWHYHFGSGLVDTCSDFGKRGTPPTHPELLDYLASRFIEEGWSLKKMHRLIMLSSTYMLSSSDDPQNRASDPDNQYHWRFNRRRLDAESLRDTMLAISGQLDRAKMQEPHPFPPVDSWNFTQHHPFKQTYSHNRRSVYLMTARLNTLPFFAQFDGADRNASTPRRDSSVTTLQALYMLNDEFVHSQATRLAERLLAERSDNAARVDWAFELLLCRAPRDDERAAALQYLDQMRGQLTAGSDGDRERQAWESVARVLFRTNEFLYVD